MKKLFMCLCFAVMLLTGCDSGSDGVAVLVHDEDPYVIHYYSKPEGGGKTKVYFDGYMKFPDSTTEKDIERANQSQYDRQGFVGETFELIEYDKENNIYLARLTMYPLEMKSFDPEKFFEEQRENYSYLGKPVMNPSKSEVKKMINELVKISE